MPDWKTRPALGFEQIEQQRAENKKRKRARWVFGTRLFEGEKFIHQRSGIIMSMHWIMRRAGEKTIVYNFVHRELTKVPSEEVATIQRTKSDREMNSEEPTREETDEFRRALVAASHSCEQFRIVLRAFPELKLGCPPEWMNKLI